MVVAVGAVFSGGYSHGEASTSVLLGVNHGCMLKHLLWFLGGKGGNDSKELTGCERDAEFLVGARNRRVFFRFAVSLKNANTSQQHLSPASAQVAKNECLLKRAPLQIK